MVFAHTYTQFSIVWHHFLFLSTHSLQLTFSFSLFIEKSRRLRLYVLYSNFSIKPSCLSILLEMYSFRVYLFFSLSLFYFSQFIALTNNIKRMSKCCRRANFYKLWKKMKAQGKLYMPCKDCMLVFVTNSQVHWNTIHTLESIK